MRRALDSFRPSVSVPSDRFLAERYVGVLLPGPPEESWVGKPVVVLMDEWSFSATDVFLGAMALVPNVVLMGTPSAGGTGRSRSWWLPGSGMSVTLSTMASFRPDGSLHDGVGIMPDIVAARTLADIEVGRDAPMIAALRYLLGVVRSQGD